MNPAILSARNAISTVIWTTSAVCIEMHDLNEFDLLARCQPNIAEICLINLIIGLVHRFPGEIPGRTLDVEKRIPPNIVGEFVPIYVVIAADMC